MIDAAWQSFTHALFHLAANPQYIQPLREEVETIIKKEGWSKAALGKMRKVDSFLKECQRLEGISSGTSLGIHSIHQPIWLFNPLASLMRKSLKDFTFSDGTFVPKGTTIMVAARSISRDDVFYENAHAFEPFRFADLRELEGETMKHQLASIANGYSPFGHGRHVWYGLSFSRFTMTMNSR